MLFAYGSPMFVLGALSGLIGHEHHPSPTPCCPSGTARYRSGAQSQ